jgi:hypothetical protein
MMAFGTEAAIFRGNTDGRAIADYSWSAGGKRLAMGRAKFVNDIVLFRGMPQ